MPILFATDFETSGLDVEKDEPYESGGILYSTGLKRIVETAGYLVKSTIPVTEEITKITGITQPLLDKFGYESQDALEAFLDMANRSDYFIGQNVIRFDKRIAESWCKRHGKTLPDKLWIDTRTDLPGCDSKHLSYMACDHGFINLFPHGAVTDNLTVLKLLEYYNIDEVIARAKQPNVVVRSHQKYEDNSLAKKLKFQWIPDPLKIWAKVIKESDIEELKNAPFKITIEKEINVEKIWYS